MFLLNDVQNVAPVSKEINILGWIIIGFVGGAMAGLTVWGVGLLREYCLTCRDKNRVYGWMQKNIPDPKDKPKLWKSTKAIASHTNLLRDRVKYICSIDERICESVGVNDDRWGIRGISNVKVQEKTTN